MALPMYRGFSSEAWMASYGKTGKLSNLELVKRDLLNHIYTIPGERVMMPDFGTRIPLLAFEQNDEITARIIKDDITMVVNYDPRVQLIDIAVLPIPDKHMIIALVDIALTGTEVRDTLRIEVTTN